jgi:hypothetical protein
MRAPVAQSTRGNKRSRSVLAASIMARISSGASLQAVAIVWRRRA